jgi:hypothetical protein
MGSMMCMSESMILNPFFIEASGSFKATYDLLSKYNSWRVAVNGS